MSSRTTVEYPNIPSILALVGGALIVLVDIFLLTISIVILPHLNYTNFNMPRGYAGSAGSLAAHRDDDATDEAEYCDCSDEALSRWDATP
jgi:hypothetical protein